MCIIFKYVSYDMCKSIKYVQKCRRLRIRPDGSLFCNSISVCYKPFCYKEISIFGEIYVTESTLDKSNINF